MGFPWTDWQFWVVTVVALWGVVAIVRSVVPRRSGPAAGCDKCETGVDTGAEESGPRLVALGRGGGGRGEG